MPMREAAEDLEAETYSTDAGSEGDSEADRKRRRPRRKRRPKPEAIAARLKTDADGVAEAAATARPARRRVSAAGSDARSIRRSWPVRAVSGGFTIHP